MSIFDAVIQGIVQGLTEFLPVSSSGHLLISQHILGVRENNLFFNVMLHIGTLIAVLAVYRKEILELICAFFKMITKIFGGKFKLNSATDDERKIISLVIGLLPLFLLFLPVPGSGMSVKDVAEELSADSNILIVGIFLLFTSFMLKKGINAVKSVKVRDVNCKGSELVFGRTNMTYMDSLWIGITQLIAAIFPGISRSGSTLSTGLMRGVDKKTALDYSFILGIPAIVAASLLELKEAFEQDLIYSIDLTPVMIGMVVSAVVGFLSIKAFKWLLKTDKMMIFVVYTFIVGLISVVIGMVEKFMGVNIFTGVSL